MFGKMSPIDMDSHATVLLLCCLGPSLALYVDHGDPYLQGTLPTTQFTLTEVADHSPLHARIILPTAPGDYAVTFFVPGLDGLLTAEVYNMYLNSVAQHGFIVIGSDYIWPARDGVSHDLDHDSKLGFITDKYMEQFYWMKSNLQGHMKAIASSVTSNWDHVALFSHSAGADSVYKMAERNHTLFQSIVFYEPFSLTFSKPTTVSLPALIIGTQLSTIYHECIIPGYGYNHFYKMWAKPPKVLMNVKNFGHCDILDDTIREVCIDVKVCLGGNATSLSAYHQFAQGVTSAFFVATVQGNKDDFQYILDQKKIPLPLVEFKYNMTTNNSL